LATLFLMVTALVFGVEGFLEKFLRISLNAAGVQPFDETNIENGMKLFFFFESDDCLLINALSLSSDSGTAVYDPTSEMKCV